jgi:hypothetical protein
MVVKLLDEPHACDGRDTVRERERERERESAGERERESRAEQRLMAWF